MSQTVTIDTLRTLAHGSISGTYAAVGTATTGMTRLVCITNNTNADCTFSTNGTADQLFVAQGSFKLFDLNTNRQTSDQLWVLPTGTQFYVATAGSATSGSVYVEVLYG